jgi:hypothetical protein
MQKGAKLVRVYQPSRFVKAAMGEWINYLRLEKVVYRFGELMLWQPKLHMLPM